MAMWESSMRAATVVCVSCHLCGLGYGTPDSKSSIFRSGVLDFSLTLYTITREPYMELERGFFRHVLSTRDVDCIVL